VHSLNGFDVREYQVVMRGKKSARPARSQKRG
jgi:hypothetical protein